MRLIGKKTIYLFKFGKEKQEYYPNGNLDSLFERVSSA
ncbi:hypothetical protein COO91_09231 (plasmid) [Nostoc flagelliforme CCNUN1]|uniref:Uncharacterized protein n=1 Tax=Nostoc flagelliforme CCNUN1 TaxID=2038116 RepID=A0A2K8T664_9NOSO|nr:hypothetical protein COO91_09231 [Nostoc flagelliforme CCNUN1]